MRAHPHVRLGRQSKDTAHVRVHFEIVNTDNLETIFVIFHECLLRKIC